MRGPVAMRSRWLTHFLGHRDGRTGYGPALQCSKERHGREGGVGGLLMHARLLVIARGVRAIGTERIHCQASPWPGRSARRMTPRPTQRPKALQ
jgi:hypothetical protein